MVNQKLTEEVFLIKNVFSPQSKFDYEPTELEEHDLEYTKMKRSIKSNEALKKLNNLSISEQIYQEYMHSYHHEDTGDNMSTEEKRFAEKESLYYKGDFTTRLPFKSYHRMARDLFVYPEDNTSVPENR